MIVVGDWADAVALGTHFGSNTINRFVKVIRSPSPGMRIPGFGALRGRDLAPDSADLRIPLVYSALRLPGATRTPLGARDCNGATLYPGDWLRDVHTGFVMRAATNDDARGLLLSIDLTHCIEPERAVLYTPDPATKVGKIAECDQGAHADAVAKRHVPAPAQGPSVFENLDEWI